MLPGEFFQKLLFQRIIWIEMLREMEQRIRYLFGRRVTLRNRTHSIRAWGRVT